MRGSKKYRNPTLSERIQKTPVRLDLSNFGQAYITVPVSQQQSNGTTEYGHATFRLDTLPTTLRSLILQNLSRYLRARNWDSIMFPSTSRRSKHSELTIPPHDSIVLAHMVNEEFPSKELEWLSRYIFKRFPEHHPYARYATGKDEKLKKYTDIWGWDDVPVWLMTPYACLDAEIQYAITDVFLQEMRP